MRRSLFCRNAYPLIFEVLKIQVFLLPFWCQVDDRDLNRQREDVALDRSSQGRHPQMTRSDRWEVARYPGHCVWLPRCILGNIIAENVHPISPSSEDLQYRLLRVQTSHERPVKPPRGNSSLDKTLHRCTPRLVLCHIANFSVVSGCGQHNARSSGGERIAGLYRVVVTGLVQRTYRGCLDMQAFCVGSRCPDLASQ